MRDVAERLPLSRAMAWFAGSYALAMLGYVGVTAIAGRMLGAASFGAFIIVLTASTLLGQAGLVGVHRAGLREAARLDLDDHDGLRGLRRDVRAVGLTTLPLTALLATTGTFLLLADESPATRISVSVGVLVLVLAGAQQRLSANFLRGFGQARTASMLEGRSGGMLVSCSQAALLLLVLLVVPEPGLGWAVGAAAGGFVVPVVWAQSRVRRIWGHVDAKVRPLADVARVIRRDWRFASNQVAGYLNAHVELWIAGLLLTATSTSLFSGASRISLLLLIPLHALQVVFSPAVARMLRDGDTKSTQRLLRTGASAAAAVTALGWVPMLVLPGLTLHLVLGAEFTAAAGILVILTLGFVTQVSVGLCGVALIMGHHEGAVAKAQWVAAIGRMTIGAAAAYWFGAYGLAVSAAVFTALTQLTMWRLVRRRMGISTVATLRPDVRLVRSTAS
jgi:O-antigen/teichoic acid export membrane protein